MYLHLDAVSSAYPANETDNSIFSIAFPNASPLDKVYTGFTPWKNTAEGTLPETTSETNLLTALSCEANKFTF